MLSVDICRIPASSPARSSGRSRGLGPSLLTTLMGREPHPLLPGTTPHKAEELRPRTLAPPTLRAVSSNLAEEGACGAMLPPHASPTSGHTR